MRIKLRWEALDQENDAIDQAKAAQTEHVAEILSNGDSVKQLLARSRYALYKKPDTWTDNQRERAQLVFERFPDLKKAYHLALELSNIFTNTQEKLYGLARLAKWHEKVRQSGFKSFNTVARSIENHYQTILNYFDNRSTNASAESFNRSGGPRQNQSIQKPVPRGKKRRILPLPLNSVICLIQVTSQHLVLIQYL